MVIHLSIDIKKKKKWGSGSVWVENILKPTLNFISLDINLWLSTNQRKKGEKVWRKIIASAFLLLLLLFFFFLFFIFYFFFFIEINKIFILRNPFLFLLLLLSSSSLFFFFFSFLMKFTLCLDGGRWKRGWQS